MDIFSVFTMIGGLALFLYGMTAMGDGLVMLSGGKLEQILEKLTSKRIFAVLLGTLVTAIIQSSSATTVMVVGFVNSGIMALRQAVGVIMGANIGTTVTSWILSLAGLNGSNIWIRLLKPSSFSPLLAGVGIILLMTSKEGNKKKTVGTILIGFAILMTGMETMSSAVAPLKENEQFCSLLTAFSNPILGLAAGAILTAIIQSSSASVGILQALCISGMVTYGTAIPIIMGQNIGTCVTALISSVGANKNAKRAAMIHLYFNLIGTMLFMVVFYTVNMFVHFSFLTGAASAAGIAVIHSLFNICCTIVLFPFADGLVWLAKKTIKDKPAEETAKEDNKPAVLAALDERFLDRPAFALQLCKNAVDQMALISKTAFELSVETLSEYSEEKAQKVIELENESDLFDDVIGTYIVKISARDLTTEDSRMMSILLHSIGNFERISDHAINVVESAQEMRDKKLPFTEYGQKEVKAFAKAVCDIVDLTVSVFSTQDVKMAKGVEPLEEVIDNLANEMKNRHVERLTRGICTFEAGIILEDIITNFERVSDHCSNVAVDLIEINANAMDTHEYLNLTVNGDDPWFRQEYNRLKDVYVLPEM